MAGFSRALELRFGPFTYENHQAQLFKLRQYGSVSEYQVKFEKLGNRVVGLPPDAILNCFISGLIPEIRNELAIQHPYSISHVVGLAKLIEVKLKDFKAKPAKTPTPQITLHFHLIIPTHLPLTSPKRIPTAQKKHQNRIPIKHIIPT